MSIYRRQRSQKHPDSVYTAKPVNNTRLKQRTPVCHHNKVDIIHLTGTCDDKEKKQLSFRLYVVSF